MSVQDEFLKEFGTTEDAFSQPEQNLEKEDVKDEQEEERVLKNRAIRRMEKRLMESERMGVELVERVKKLSEVDKFRAEVGDDDLKKLEMIFGADTPEKKKGIEMLKEIFDSRTEKAKALALTEIENIRANQGKEKKDAESSLDDIMNIADEDYGIDMEDAADRRGFLALLEKMSPKDNEGNIIEYADPEATAELYIFRKKNSSSTNRAKELSSRSMTTSGASQPSKLQQTSLEKFMKENDLGF